MENKLSRFSSRFVLCQINIRIAQAPAEFKISNVQSLIYHLYFSKKVTLFSFDTLRHEFKL